MKSLTGKVVLFIFIASFFNTCFCLDDFLASLSSPHKINLHFPRFNPSLKAAGFDCFLFFSFLFFSFVERVHVLFLSLLNHSVSFIRCHNV